eukprot:8692072-Pyramimonas_sp.AAC.1
MLARAHARPFPPAAPPRFFLASLFASISMTPPFVGPPRVMVSTRAPLEPRAMMGPALLPSAISAETASGLSVRSVAAATAASCSDGDRAPSS